MTAGDVRLQMGFDNEQWWEAPAFDGETLLENGEPAGDGGTFHMEGDQLILIGAHGQAQVTVEWVLDGDQLTLTVIEECVITPDGLECQDDRTQMDPIMLMMVEDTYTKSGDDPWPWLKEAK